MTFFPLKDYNRIYAVESFFPEYRGLFGKDEAAYQTHLKKLRFWLDRLDAEGQKAVDNNGIKRLIKEDGLLEIRQMTKNNVRSFFVFMDGDGRCLLLTPCMKKSKTDSTAAINRAKKILSEVEVSK